MKLKIKSICIPLFFVLCAPAFAYDTSINTPIKNFLKCEIEYQNTGDKNKFKACADVVFDDYDVLIKDIRVRNNYSNKQKWNSINKNLLSFKETCENNAIKTQKNSTIQRDIISCRHLFYRSLAISASSLN